MRLPLGNSEILQRINSLEEVSFEKWGNSSYFVNSWTLVRGSIRNDGMALGKKLLGQVGGISHRYG